jgi:glycosyltransferase involved in cell wall biosynthesis
MIKVVYDYQIFSLQKYGGVSRYFANLALALSKNPDFQVKIDAGFYNNEYINSSHASIISGTKVDYIPNLNKALITLNSWSGQIKLKMNRPDIIHETYYQKPNLFNGKNNRVITVYDMIHEKFSKSKEREPFLEIKRQAIENAARIICISDNTRKDVIEILKVNPDRIQTIYLGHSVDHFETQSKTALVNVPYILFVGERQYYKNFDRLLKSYASNLQISNNFHIVCFGSKPFNSEEINLVTKLGINTNKLRYISGDDSILANLYTHASALVYPSLYEGFGIPPLEAMSFNCPVICSNVSSIPEIVSDAGEYFDPYDIDSMAEAMAKVLFDATRSHDLIQNGKQRVKFFSWDKCALETGNVYRQLV